MNDKVTPAERSHTTTTSRRKILIGSAAAGLACWQKPVINSMVLPAHAQTSADLDAQNKDFFVTVAAATIVVRNKQNLTNRPDEDADELSFEAEAISQGGGVFNLKIAAEPTINGKTTGSRQAPSNFKYGWEGQASSASNTASLMTATGCAQNESLSIISLSQNSLVVEMGYFGETIRLDLVDANASLPSFPLNCVT